MGGCWDVAYASPTRIWIDDEDSFLVKNIFYDCIPIHSDAILTEYTIMPELPQGLSIDKTRSCIGGIYSGSFYGLQQYHIHGSNSEGLVRSSITLYYTRTTWCNHWFAATLPPGLHAEFYEVNPGYKDTVEFDDPVDFDSITLKQLTRFLDFNYSRTDLSAPFYSYGISEIETIYGVMSGYLYFPYSSRYFFRVRYDSETEKVSPFLHLNE